MSPATTRSSLPPGHFGERSTIPSRITPPTSHRPARRRDTILAAALPPIGDPSIATRPGRERGASSSIFAITTPPRLCPTRCSRSLSDRLDELPQGSRRLREPATPGTVPEVAHAETGFLQTSSEDAHFCPRHPKPVNEDDRFALFRYRDVPAHDVLPAGIISHRSMVDCAGERTCDPFCMGCGNPRPACSARGSGSTASSRRPLVSSTPREHRPRRDRQTVAPRDPPLHPDKAPGPHRPPDVRPESARGGRDARDRARNPERHRYGGS